MSVHYRLTTIDNPYDVFDNFDLWLLFDVEQGYNTCGYLDRVSNTSDDMSDAEVDAEIERAIDEIIKHDPFNVYRKVKRGYMNDKSDTQGGS